MPHRKTHVITLSFYGWEKKSSLHSAQLGNALAGLVTVLTFGHLAASYIPTCIDISTDCG